MGRVGAPGPGLNSSCGSTKHSQPHERSCPDRPGVLKKGNSLIYKAMRGGGFEPPWVSPLDPKLSYDFQDGFIFSHKPLNFHNKNPIPKKS